MKITNFSEYNAALRELWSHASAEELESYLHELKSSGVERDTNKKKIAAEIKSIKCRINFFRQKIKETQNLETKKDFSSEIKECQKMSAMLVKKYADYERATRFQALSPEARSYACTDILLKKFLAAEIMENNPLNFSHGAEGDILVDIEALKGSQLYQEAAHIRDYVSAYIQEAPQKVSRASWFKNLHKDVHSWNGLVTAADDYFTEANRRAIAGKNTDEIIKNSREGFETVKIYPEYNLQAVRLISKEAFEYEGNEMGHCVASYHDNSEHGKLAIYSIRDYLPDGKLSPHATYEFKDGKIKQIKGHSDRVVNHRYIAVARDFAMELSGAESLDELMHSADIPDSELKNIGYVKDNNKKVWDLFNILADEACFDNLYAYGDDLGCFDLEKININTLNIMGNVTAKAIKSLGSLKNLASLNFVKAKSAPEKYWDFSSLKQLKTLDLTSFDFSGALKISLPAGVEELKLPEIRDSVCLDFFALQNLKSVTFNGGVIDRNLIYSMPETIEELKVQNVDFAGNINFERFPKLKTLDLGNCRCSNHSQMLLPSSLERAFMQRMETYQGFISFPNGNNLKNVDLNALRYPEGRIVIGSSKDIEKRDVNEVREVLKSLANDQLESLTIRNVKFIEESSSFFQYFPKLKNLTFEGVNVCLPVPLRFPESLENFRINDSTYAGVIDLHSCKKLAYFGSLSSDLRNADFIFPKEISQQKNLGLSMCKIGSDFDFSPFTGISFMRLCGNDLHDRKKELVFPPNITFLDLGGKLPDNLKELDLRTYKGLESVSLGGMWSKNMEKIIFPENLEAFDIDEIGINPALQELDFSHCRHFENFNETFLPEKMKIKFPACIKPLKFEELHYGEGIRIELHPDTPPETVKMFKDNLGAKVTVAPKKMGKEGQCPVQIANLPQVYKPCRGM